MLQSRSPVERCSARVLSAALALGLAGLGLGLGGCSSAKKPGLSPDERANATPMQADLYSKLGYRVEWRGFPTLLPGAKVSQLDIEGDSVIAQDSSGVVSVLETKSGQTRWSDQAAGALTKFVGNIRSGDRLLVASESEVFIYEMNSGTLKARQKLAQVATTKPVLVGQMLVFGADRGRVLGHFLPTGFSAWTNTLGGSVETPTLPLSRGRVAMVSSVGDVAVIDGLSGASQARAKIFAGASGNLAASDSALFVASLDQSVYAFDQVTGKQLWRVRTSAPLTGSPAYLDGRVFVEIPGQGLTALDAVTGNQVWANSKVAGSVVGIRNKRLFVWDGSTATLVDPAKGSIIESQKLEGVSLLRTDSFADGALYLASPAGVITKLSVK